MAAQSRRLGKGLGALFPTIPGDEVSHDVSRETSVNAKPKELQQVHANSLLEPGNRPLDALIGGSTTAAKTAQRSTTGSTSSRKKKSNRPTMPSLTDVVHPSDMFFSNSTAPASSDLNKTDEPHPVVSDKTSQDNVTIASASRQQAEEPSVKPVAGGYLKELETSDIVPNDKQPRTVFDEDELEELSRSIQEVGILQPIVVRRRSEAAIRKDQSERSSSAVAHYELIMGERRWRATQRAGIDTIPAIVKTTADNEMLRDALLENLHRVALNPLEEAAAYQQMIREFGLTQAELAKSVSKSRPQIANTLRLLQLPPSVQKKVASNVLSAGHARALLSLSDEEAMEKLANRIIAEGLSVRSTEEIVAMETSKASEKPKKQAHKNIWAGTETLQSLENRFDTKVAIKGTKKHGRIEITFASEEDFDRILQLLNSDKQDGQQGKWV